MRSLTHKIILLIFLAFLLTCEQREFVEIAAVRTGQSTNILARSATLEGDVVDVGSGVQDHGHCWSTGNSPSVNDHKTSYGVVSGKTVFSSAVTGLVPGSTYYYRSYVISNGVEMYGISISFETLDGYATVNTVSVTNITVNSAVSGGEITDEGEAAITARGGCWNTTGDPTIADNKTEDGSGTGSFTSSLTGLTPNMRYYVRSYAVNSFGTEYGNEVTFTTLTGKPTLTTAAITYITPNTATGGGEITDDGGAEITFRGVCWNTAGEPTISDFMTEDGSGTGSFTSSLTGLNPNTTYYVRAYATTSVGTEYGDQLIFMTLVDPTTTTVDYDGNEFDSVIIGDQEWMAENLKVTHYPDGSDIPHVTGNSTWAALGDNNTSDAYCWYNDDEATNKDKYGALYTYSAAINACPTGWHLPSDAEWTELENYLIANGYNWDGTTSGDKTGKSLATTSGWSSSSEAGDVGNDQSSNNTTGFMALPGGYRYSYNGSFDTAGFSGYWWSSTEVSSTGRALAYNYADLSRNYYYKSSGFSIRCLRD